MGMAYTDEGWWSRNALSFVRDGHWYIDDGYNTVFSLPVLSLLQVAWFKVFGASLTAARLLNVLFSVVISGLVYAIARREIESGLALDSALYCAQQLPNIRIQSGSLARNAHADAGFSELVAGDLR